MGYAGSGQMETLVAHVPQSLKDQLSSQLTETRKRAADLQRLMELLTEDPKLGEALELVAKLRSIHL